METIQINTPSYQAPKQTRHYEKTPTNRRELETCFLNALRSIFLKTHDTKTYNNQFSLSEVCKYYGIKDGRIIPFLQDVGILKKVGRNRGTKWFWIADIKPTPLIASNVVIKWNKWKKNKGLGKNVFISRFPELESEKNKRDKRKIAPTSPKSQVTQVEIFQELEEPVTNSEIPNPQLERTIKEVVDMAKDAANKRKQSDNRWSQLMTKLDNLRDLSLRNHSQHDLTQEILAQGHLYVDIPVLFGLFKIKTTINLK